MTFNHLFLSLLIVSTCNLRLNSEAKAITLGQQQKSIPINLQINQNESPALLDHDNKFNSLEFVRARRSANGNTRSVNSEGKSESGNNNNVSDDEEIGDLLDATGHSKLNRDNSIELEYPVTTHSNEDYILEAVVTGEDAAMTGNVNSEIKSFAPSPPKRGVGNLYGQKLVKLMTPMNFHQHHQILSKDESIPASTSVNNVMQSPSSSSLQQRFEIEQEQQQEQAKRLYANRVVPFSSWDPKQHIPGATYNFKGAAAANHPNGLGRSFLSPFTINKMSLVPTTYGFGSNPYYYQMKSQNEDLDGTTFRDEYSLGSSLKSPLHESLGTLSAISYSSPSFTSPQLNVQNPQYSLSTQKRNSNYMCHFKLCQIGASGKRRWTPPQWFFADYYDHGGTDTKAM